MDSNANLSELLNLSARVFTFMSIDVAGSTQLKVGQNEQDIIYTFLAYHKLVSGLAYEHHGEVATISGDGIMCRFQKPDDGAHMAKELIARLSEFNKKENHLTKSFGIRIGVHTGEVLQNETMSSGQIISKTLDITAKLQQDAETNQACFSEATVALLGEEGKKLQRKGWNAALGTNVYAYSGDGTLTETKVRKLPEPALVLIVEPELEDLSILKKSLFGNRFDTFFTFSQNQAMVSVGARMPHLVILSLDLAWKAGWEYLSSLRSDHAMSQVPIIAMSGQTSGDAVQKALIIGANGFLRKPLDQQQISKRVEMVLREFYL